MNNLVFNSDQLRKRCLASEDDYLSEGECVQVPGGRYIFKDNGSKVLAVAHLDTVCSHTHYWDIEIGGEHLVYNAQLDDRLGAYVILDLLPSLGLKYDILLTTNEEHGRSTGADFKPPRQYNWMFMFDRAGIADTVIYQYDCEPLRQALNRHQMSPAVGSYSCIASMDHIGCRGINVGCGYQNSHSPWASLFPDELLRQVDKFVAFYDEFRDTKMPYTKPATTYVHTGYYGLGGRRLWDHAPYGSQNYRDREYQSSSSKHASLRTTLLAEGYTEVRPAVWRKVYRRTPEDDLEKLVEGDIERLVTPSNNAQETVLTNSEGAMWKGAYLDGKCDYCQSYGRLYQFRDGANEEGVDLICIECKQFMVDHDLRE